MFRTGTITVLLALAMAAGCTQAPAETSLAQPAQRILIVAPLADLEAASVFAEAIAAAGRPLPPVVATLDYAPLVDARAFDGFDIMRTFWAPTP
jgi:hypothetical protein